MNVAKVVAIAVVVVLVLGILSVGAAYLITSGKQKRIIEDLEQAKALLENGEDKAALVILKKSAAANPDSPVAAETMFLLGKTMYKQEEESEKALAVFDRLLEDYPNSAWARQADYYKTVTLLDNRPISRDTREYFEKVIEKDANTQAVAVARFGVALDDLESGKDSRAREVMLGLLEEKLPEELRSQVEYTLGDINMRILYSPETTDDDEYYTIKRGDYIYKLAQKFDVPQELILKCNGIDDPRRLQIDQRIKIPKVDFSIVVDKSDNTLTLLNNGKFFKKYPVRTGAYENQTPVGEFKIQNKKKDPRWVNPRTLEVYPPGDPKNELGSRWMSFKNDRLGIHGTIQPETIGYYSSFGCVGMLEEDVEELFDLVPVGTPLKIVGEMDPKLVEKSEELGYRD